MLPICQFILWFMFYNVVGWVYETIVCSVQERRLVINRGFLTGPYCPLYGCGALLDVFLLSWIHNPVLLFFAGMLVNCSLEYFTGWLLERLFHAKWWDYTGWFLNIKGRVCFLGAVAFGSMSVLLIKWIHPFVVRTSFLLPPLVTYLLAGFLSALFVTDFVATNLRINQLNQKLQLFQHKLGAKNVSTNSISPSGDEMSQEKEDQPFREMSENLSFQEKHMLRNALSFQSTKYRELVDRLKDTMGYK